MGSRILSGFHRIPIEFPETEKKKWTVVRRSALEKEPGGIYKIQIWKKKSWLQGENDSRKHIER